jgi:two-component system, cell cycle sensor histidine kinase and response regulator CckA
MRIRSHICPLTGAVDGPDNPAEFPGGCETILMVEDDPFVWRTNYRILERLGYRVLGARDPREAFEALDKLRGPLDLVLTDVVLPRMDGNALAREILKRRPEARLLFASGYATETVAQRGVNCFLPKPYSPQQLARTIREILDAPVRLAQAAV